jgi:hypothetical protein
VVWPDWSGETVAVVAGGSSAAVLTPQLAGRCRIIVVNLAFRLLPDADVLYAADSGFWHWYRDACRFAGLKLAPCDQHVDRYCPKVVPVTIARDRLERRVDRLVKGPVGTIGCGGGNGAFQAINLAAQFGAARILLAGVDYCGRHWHEDHPPQLRNPSERQLRQWREILDGEASTLQAWGVEVINLSPVSALRAYRYVKMDEVIYG